MEANINGEIMRSEGNYVLGRIEFHNNIPYLMPIDKFTPKIKVVRDGISVSISSLREWYKLLTDAGCQDRQICDTIDPTPNANSNLCCICLVRWKIEVMLIGAGVEVR